MKKNKEIKKELEALGSYLAENDIQENYSIPTNYFKNLQIDLKSELEIENKSIPSQAQTISTWSWKNILLNPVIGFASILILTTVAFFLFQESQDSEVVVDNLSTEEIESYISTNIEDFDIELLSQLEINEYSFLPNELDQENINDYLQENLDDLDESLLEEIF